MLALLAQAVGGYSIVHILVLVVVIAAVVALMYVALRQFGIQIPDWVRQVFWIVVVAVVVIFAIKIVVGLL